MLYNSMVNSSVKTTREYWREVVLPKFWGEDWDIAKHLYIYLTDEQIEVRLKRIQRRIDQIPKKAPMGHFMVLYRNCEHKEHIKELWRKELESRNRY
jgi:hypothetical protein